jgi:hypothetical protein
LLSRVTATRSWKGSEASSSWMMPNVGLERGGALITDVGVDCGLGGEEKKVDVLPVARDGVRGDEGKKSDLVRVAFLFGV